MPLMRRENTRIATRSLSSRRGILSLKSHGNLLLSIWLALYLVLLISSAGDAHGGGSPASTTTTIICTPTSVSTNSVSTCSATVAGDSPTGSVSWTQTAGTGSVAISTSACTLSSSSCQVTLTGSSAGSVAVQASYGGDSNNQVSSSTTQITVTTPTLSLSPTRGPTGTTVSFFGNGYSTSYTYNFCYEAGDSTPAACSAVDTFTSTASGAIPGGQVAKISGTGSGLLVVSDATTNSVVAYTSFAQSTPVIRLSSNSGLEGSSVSVTGSGFTADIPVATLTYAGSGPATETCTSQTASASGAFSCTFTVPSSRGTNLVTISGDDVGSVPADTASATFFAMAPLSAPPTPAISAAALDANQVENITDSIPTSGVSPYGWAWLVSSNGGAYTVATECTVDSGSGASAGAVETCTINTNTLLAVDHYNFEFQVTDSSPSTQTSGASPMVAVSMALSAGHVIPADPSLDLGQSIQLAAFESGGTAGITYSWYAGAGCTSSPIGTGSIISVSPASTTTYYYKVTDSATTPEAACSTGDTVTVNPTLTSPSTPIVNSTTVNAYQDLAVTSTIASTGTPAYSWQWLVSVDGAGYVNAGQCALRSGTGAGVGAEETCIVPSGKLTIGHTYSFELQVTDDSSTNETDVSEASSVVSAVSPLQSPSITVSLSTIEQTQSSTLASGGVSTGAAPYRYQWYVETPGASTFSLITGATTSSYTFQTTSATSTGTWTFQLQVTDSESPPMSVTSVATVAVNPLPSSLVEQPISVTRAPGYLADATVSVVGCNPDPAQFPANGSVFIVKMDPDCSYSLVFENSGDIRDGFSESGSFDSISSFHSSSTSLLTLVAYQQVQITLSYSVTGGAGYSAPTFSSEQMGSKSEQYLTSRPTSYWFDAGSDWVVTNPLEGSTQSQSWTTYLLTSGTISSPFSTIFVYDFYNGSTVTTSTTSSVSSSTSMTSTYSSSSRTTSTATTSSKSASSSISSSTLITSSTTSTSHTTNTSSERTSSTSTITSSSNGFGVWLSDHVLFVLALPLLLLVLLLVSLLARRKQRDHNDPAVPT
jgi:trimeric autotransporter adhesin